MYSCLDVVTLAGAGRDEALSELRRAAADLPGLRGALIAPTLDGAYNGGDVIMRLTFDGEAAAQRAAASDAGRAVNALLGDPAWVSRVDHVGFAANAAGGPSRGGGVYRVALFCANVRPTAERLETFARHTVLMPNHVRSIGRWQLSQPREATGARNWTHVWEQEYADLSGLLGAYMMHPVHWAHVERWFDPEYPEWLVDTELVHAFCAIEEPAIIA